MSLKLLKDKKIILASKSPRRQQFIKDLGVNFEVKTKDIEEIYPEELEGEEITNYLAELKASAFENEINPGEILLTSDTIVWLKGKALGKPKDKKEAFIMLQKLSGRKHKVITSVCLKSLEKTITFSDVTVVHFDDLSSEEIDFYLDTFKPYDKAGSYGIQDWIGLIGVKKIKGSYFNVVGLPVHKVYKELLKF
ncbi:Maf-like protein [Aureivirga sp. CE67]|uniref:Maf-like protein n=1 Tax=Aureivirga sp. CE67 TaxID=1788983 RepID=UPI0018CBBEFD|nr:Maf-like protein [Aureivirga sp. CE67]